MILVFGSLNVDLVMAVPALPRPGETVLAPEYRALAGGKGANQAAAAARAGAAVRMAGAVGDDDFGRAALSALRTAGVDTALVERVSAPTGCAAVLVDPAGENAIAVASGANREARADRVPPEALDRATTLVLQMEVPAPESAALAARARAAGARVVLNLAPAIPPPPELPAAADVLVVNRPEAEALAPDAGEGPAAVARRLAAAFDVVAVVTLGDEGAVAAAADGRGWAVDAAPVAVVDTTGAGDAFVGVLAAGLDSGDGLARALRRASAAAALACTAPGARGGLPDRAAIDRLATSLPPPRRLSP